MNLRRTTNLDAASNTAWRAFLTVHTRVIDLIEQELAQAELPPLEWYDVLFALKEAPEHKLRLHELAQAVLISRSNMTRLVDRLEAAGLIYRERCKSDRRGASAVLTEAGLAMQQRMWCVYSQGIAKYFATHLSEEEVGVLTKAFKRVLAAVDEQASATQ
ncbi:MarR family winged helix-turn-helix transcriptional regulator [Scytonema sp. PRP1]|uniref:MarR family winged helix-turn-helix transcriptional regulator n=1 Tax=Scytonema sp. PRP1 TaxID=3120513 RepID=UPI00300C05CA